MRLYRNRKWRKKVKLQRRFTLAFWDSMSDPYKGFQREIILMICKSSSLETFRKVDEKLNIKHR